MSKTEPFEDDLSTTLRVELSIGGAVQGVGFRPFLYRLAVAERLGGWVRNDVRGVEVAIEGRGAAISRFEERIRAELPPNARIDRYERAVAGARGEPEFRILPSAASANRGDLERDVALLPDLAPCPDCLVEMFDPSDRRHRYPFINCTNCGPRFSIITDLPYDRRHTTMRSFEMCPRCRAEYEDPANRRFHAQPNACPECGPRARLLAPDGTELAENGAAIERAVAALQRGAVVAVKGAGGFHLLCDAASTAAVSLLRQRKSRPTKPLALMYRSISAIRVHAAVDDPAAELLKSQTAPIVLLPRGIVTPGDQHHTPTPLSPLVAPGTPAIGVMLPSTPLHALLLEDFAGPLVATSGNLADEPICTDERTAMERLGAVADLFLVHDRPIARHADDSIARFIDGHPVLLRRGRGYTPVPLRLATSGRTVLATGGHLKNTVAVARSDQVLLGQHVGDLSTPAARRAHAEVARLYRRIYRVEPDAAACDLHPDYASTATARRLGVPVETVQHHHAHAVSCMAEHGLDEALAWAWDGTGLGTDGTIWGGELLLAKHADFQRRGRLRAFRLPGGEAAIREPRRIAVALAVEALGADPEQLMDLAAGRSLGSALNPLITLLARGVNAPVTTSAGRLFDGLAALAGIAQVNRYEAEAAVRLEAAGLAALDGRERPADLPPPAVVTSAVDGLIELDWRPLIAAVIAAVTDGERVAPLALGIHQALAEAMVTGVAATALGLPVVLTGGCLQNRLLAELAADRLRAAGYSVYLHRAVPPNDGGLAVGQAVCARARLG